MKPSAIMLVLVTVLYSEACQSYAASRPTLGGALGPRVSTGEANVGRGVACRRNDKVGPPSYSVTLIGKPDVPRLSAADLATLHRIIKYVHPATLRFAYLDKMPEHRRFIVFNARPNRLCDPTQTPFVVLNGACNEYYEPLDVMFTTTAAMGCVNPPRPWIPGDRGTGKTSWSAQLKDQ